MNIPEALMVLRAAYPSQDIPDSTLKLFATELDDLAPADVEQAVHDLIKSSHWFPVVADIREQVQVYAHRRYEEERARQRQLEEQRQAEARALRPPEEPFSYEEWAKANPEQAKRLQQLKVAGISAGLIVRREMGAGDLSANSRSGGME